MAVKIMRTLIIIALDVTKDPTTYSQVKDVLYLYFQSKEAILYYPRPSGTPTACVLSAFIFI